MASLTSRADAIMDAITLAEADGYKLYLDEGKWLILDGADEDHSYQLLKHLPEEW